MMKPSDIFTPMMIKELRQELRSKFILRLFFWSQLSLVLVYALYLMAEAKMRSTQLVFSLIVGLQLIVMGILLPGRGWQGFIREERSNSLELLTLTKLSGIRIVLGKWLAIVALTTLYCMSLLPHLVFAYFLARLNVVNLFSNTALIFLTSIGLSAFTLTGSAFQKGKTSVMLSAGFAVLFAFLLASTSRLFAYSGGIGKGIDFIDFLVLLSYVTLTALELFLVAAARIGPVYENYSAAKRLTALLVLALTWLLFALGFGNTMLIAACSTVFLALFAIGTSFENLHPLIPMRVQHKTITPWLTYSGWPQAFVCTLLLFIGQGVLFKVYKLTNCEHPALAAAFICAGIILPRITCLLVPRTLGNSPLAYLILFTAFGVLSAVFESLRLPISRGTISGLAERLPSIFPLSVGIAMFSRPYFGLKYDLTVTGTVLVVEVLLLLYLFRRDKRQLFHEHGQFNRE